ncbi:DUF3307 domain-containing protein [Pseudalkalibacillus sp. Hm43]|uniref:DUF3307 domain-containing protein n=1 Tax=Pseudalkalibacillus sp. Hm43 TaxID=3450742 RepID=UPI003F41C52C
MFQFLLVILFTHFLADFVLQTNRIIRLKKDHLHKGLGLHVLIHFVVMLIGTVIYFTWGETNPTTLIVSICGVLISIALTHYAVDWLKEWINRQHDRVGIRASLFILDQFVHVTFILLFFNLFGLSSYSWIELNNALLTFLFDGVEVTDLSKLLMIGVILILATEGAGYFLGIVLRDLGPNPTLQKNMYSITDEKTEIKTFFNEKGEEVNEVTTIRTDQYYKDSPKQIGRYIGMIERVLIMIFIVQGIPHGMTFLIAVKSLTRFKQFESKSFAEYYLIGSLLSAGIGIVLGYGILRIL